MENVQDSCNLRSNLETPNLAPMVSVRKQILPGTDNPSFYTTLWNPPHVVQERAVTLKATFLFDDEGPPSRPVPAPNIPPTIRNIFRHPLLRATIREMAIEEASCIHALGMDKENSKTTEKSFSNAFQIVCEEANDDLMNVSFYFAEIALTKISQPGALDKMFERNLEKLTQSPTFIDAFKTRALTLPRYYRPVPKCIRAMVEKKTHFGRNLGKNMSFWCLHRQLFLLCQIR